MRVLCANQWILFRTGVEAPSTIAEAKEEEEEEDEDRGLIDLTQSSPSHGSLSSPSSYPQSAEHQLQEMASGDASTSEVVGIIDDGSDADSDGESDAGHERPTSVHEEGGTDDMSKDLVTIRDQLVAGVDLQVRWYLPNCLLLTLWIRIPV